MLAQHTSCYTSRLGEHPYWTMNYCMDLSNWCLFQVLTSLSGTYHQYKTSQHPNRAYGTKQWFVLIQISKSYSLLCVGALITIIQFLCLLLIPGSLANWNSVLSLPLLFQGNLTELPFQDLSGTAAKIMFDCFLIAVITVMDSDSELLYTFQ